MATSTRTISLLFLLAALAPSLLRGASGGDPAPFTLTVFGVGGHGAYPHLAKDPILLAAQITSFLAPPDGPLRIHRIEGGTKRNVIPERVLLHGEIRGDARRRRRLRRSFLVEARALARAMGLPSSRLPRWGDARLPTAKTRERSARDAGLTPPVPAVGRNARAPWIDLVRAAREAAPRWLAFYRDLHRHAELSLQEKRTAARVAKVLDAQGYAVTPAVDGHSLVAVLRNGPGPTVMLRADMDALPVEERTDAPYASRERSRLADGREVPVMHACGHDVHTTCLVATAERLAAARDLWSGTLLVVAQGAEELGLGAKGLIEAGLFRRWPRPDCILAQHCDAGLAAGKVGIKAGWYNAGIHSVDLVFRGRRAGLPHAPTQAARCLVALQSLVSRAIEPSADAVVTAGRIHGPPPLRGRQEIHLEFTIRSREPAVAQLLLAGLERHAREAARAAGARGPFAPTVRIHERHLPPTRNDETVVAHLRTALAEILGPGAVTPGHATMGGDDFGFYAACRPPIPVCYTRLGTVAPEHIAAGVPLPGLHNPNFLPRAAPCLLTGTLALTRAALAMFAHPPSAPREETP